MLLLLVNGPRQSVGKGSDSDAHTYGGTGAAIQDPLFRAPALL